MARYVAMVPPDGRRDRAELVRDGFSLFGLVLPLIWLLVNRLWLAAAAFVDLAMLYSAAAYGLDLPALALGCEIATAIFIAVEGGNLKVATLEGRGWRQLGAFDAGSVEDAERRFFAILPSTVAPPPIPARAAPAPAIGSTVAAQAAFAFPSRG